MDTFFNTIRDFFNVIITPGIYPDYIEDEERMDRFTNTLSSLERGVTINRIDSDERLHKAGGEDLPSTLTELFFGWISNKIY
jgi:hypothetical protein